MEKGKGVMGGGRRWAVDFTDNSISPSSRDIADPPGFTRASQDQVLSLSLSVLLSIFYTIESLVNYLGEYFYRMIQRLVVKRRMRSRTGNLRYVSKEIRKGKKIGLPPFLDIGSRLGFGLSGPRVGSRGEWLLEFRCSKFVFYQFGFAFCLLVLFCVALYFVLR